MSRFDKLLRPAAHDDLRKAETAPRRLTEITDDIEAAMKDWSASHEKLAGDVSLDGLRKNSDAWRRGSDNVLKLLKELQGRLDEIADQPLPIGYSHVSKQFLEGAPTNGAMHSGVGSFDAAAALAALEQDQRNRETFNRLNKFGG